MDASGTLGEGNIEIEIDGQKELLRPTYQCARAISQLTGGIMGAVEKVLKLDIDLIVQIITLGLGYGPTQGRKPPPDLAEKIWRSGLTDDTSAIVAQTVSFLRVLAAGGRRPSDEVSPTRQPSHPQGT